MVPSARPAPVSYTHLGLLAGFSQSYVVVLGIYYKLQTFLYLPALSLIHI